MVRPSTVVWLCALLVGCAPSSPTGQAAGEASPRPAETVSDVLAEAEALERARSEEVFSGDHAVSIRARREYALTLAEFSDRAAGARLENENDALVQRLFARRADTHRDSLLACRFQRWNVDPARPEHPVRRLGALFARKDWSSRRREDALRRFPKYVDTVESELEAGLEEELVASRHSTERALQAVDRWLSRSTDTPTGPHDAVDLWVTPALRRYRETLRERVHPVARSGAGLSSLPGGARCYAAEVRRQLGPTWSADRLRRESELAVDVAHRRLRRLADQLDAAPDLPIAKLPRALAATAEVDDAPRAARQWAATVWPREARRVGLDSIAPPAIEALPDDGGELVRFTDGAVAIRFGVADAVLVEPLLAAGGFPGAAAMHQSATSPFTGVWFRGVRSVATTAGWRVYAAGLVEHYSGANPRVGVAWLELRAAAEARADVGVHADGWTPKQAREYLVATADFAPARANRLTDEIVAFPARRAAALAGLRDLRSAADSRADVAEFHRRLLRVGPLPLDLVSSQ